MAAVLSSSKVFTTSKNHQILKSSISSLYSPILHRQPRLFRSTRLTNKTHLISCSKVTSSAIEFPCTNWWRQKFAEVAFEVAKAFILWVCDRLYKKRIFLTNLPFAKGDLVEMKVDGNLICGLVEDIGHTQTSIRGADDGFLKFVPNSEVKAKTVKVLTLVTTVQDAKTKADAEQKELRLWGVTINMQLSFESCDSMNAKIKQIRDVIISDKRVREHERIMVSFESYLPDKNAFKILVGFFVEAQKNIKEYSDIKVEIQMQLAEKVK